MKITLIIMLICIVGFALWVRLAPTDAGRWHVTPPDVPKRWQGGVNEIVSGDSILLARLFEVALATPRTNLLAGSLDEGQVTFVTRSRLWGFPDYTTLAHEDGQITLYARLRFGRSDMGVNAARVSDWLERAQAVQR